VANVLHRPLLFEPGSEFYYTDGNPQLVVGAIEAASGTSAVSFAEDRLFAPLGIVTWRWERHADGLPFGAVGLWLRPRDMAKVGQLALQKGMWNERQVVPAAWVEESTRVHANGDYGYYWWVHQEGLLYSAKGDGEQMILVAPTLDMVVVLTGDPGSRSWEMSPGLGTLVDRLLQAAR
jgi:CubicO group peptidase (beta-lactamase class C family)